MMKRVDLCVIAVVAPVKIGVYENGSLIATHSDERPASESLPEMLEACLHRYAIERIVFVRGPGSFMAIKVAYVTLRTLSLVKEIPLWGMDAFACNGGTPVRATGQSMFIKEGGEIRIVPNEQKRAFEPLTLPLVLQEDLLSQDIEPLYILPAI